MLLLCWDPYLKQDINKLERVQNQAARFITGDYRTREKGCITSMLRRHNIPTLESRRRENRLAMMHKLANDGVPALPKSVFLVPAKPRKQLKTPHHLKDFQTDTSAIDRLIYNHPNCFVVPSSKTEQYENSFFVKTILEWNHLDKCVAGSKSPEEFRSNFNKALF